MGATYVLLDSLDRTIPEKVQCRTHVHRRAVCQPDLHGIPGPAIRRPRLNVPHPLAADLVWRRRLLIVSLNWRMLEKPEANATSLIEIDDVSNNSLAVRARWARASALGPTRLLKPAADSTAVRCSQPRPPILRHLVDRLLRQRSIALPGQQDRLARSIPGSRVRYPDDTVCRPEIQPPARQQPSGKTTGWISSV